MTAPDAPDETLALEDFLRRPKWHQRAACRGAGPSDYVRGAGGNYAGVRTMCGDCPVRQDCLEAALADTDLVGLGAGRRRSSGGRSGGGHNLGSMFKIREVTIRRGSAEDEWQTSIEVEAQFGELVDQVFTMRVPPDESRKQFDDAVAAARGYVRKVVAEQAPHIE